MGVDSVASGEVAGVDRLKLVQTRMRYLTFLPTSTAGGRKPSGRKLSVFLGAVSMKWKQRISEKDQVPQHAI